MSNPDRDPVVRRAIDELRKVPRTDHAAISRVVSAAAAARVAPADDDTMTDFGRVRRVRWWTLTGVAAAAAFVGFALSSARHSSTESVPARVGTAPMSAAATGLQSVANNSADVLPIAKQFVFNSRIAHTVSVVGDFNTWSPDSARMTRAADGDLWSITVPILPGRHMYGFMVDDSIFVLDPRENTARNSDLGVDASVTIVGKP